MKIGDKWKDWTVDSLLGEGSFGQVYKVVRNEFGHTYESALKVIRIPQNRSEVESIRDEGMEEQSITTYFRSMVDEIVNEFTMMAELRGHSNIVSYEDHSVMPLVDDFGWEICIRMELLTPLNKYLKAHNISISDVIHIGIDICKALEVCQRFNLIHRDIKPENIFVSNIGTFKLGDFGIARQMEKTTSGMSKKGTYSYMAPEVYKGLPYNSTVDLYSLGIVLYRLLNNNRTPFLPPYPQPIKYSDRERANVCRMSGQKIPAPVNAQGRLAEIILKACAFDPAERYESAADMRRALESILYNPNEARIIYPGGDGLRKADFTGTGSGSFGGSRVSYEPSVEGSDVTVSLFNASSGSVNMSGTINGAPAASAAAAASGIALYPDMPESSIEYTSVRDLPEEASQDGSIRFTDAPQEDTDDFTEPMPDPDASPEQDFYEMAAVQDEDEYDEYDATIADPSLMYGIAGAAGNVPVPDGSFGEGTVDIDDDPADMAAGAVTDAKKSGKEKSKDKPDGKKKGILPVILGLLAVAALVGGFFIYKYMNHVVPDVREMTAEHAKETIENAGLAYYEEREFNDEVERGEVISQVPAADEHLRQGSNVKVIISRGKAIECPDLAGKSMKDAESICKKAGLKLEVGSEENSDKIAKDAVISQEPAPGTECEKDSVVTVVKSKGKVQVKVPNVIGKGIDEATKALEKEGFKVEVTTAYSSSVAAGNVCAQSVEGGQTTDKGATITITKSIGAQPAPKKKSTKKKKKKKKKSSSSDDDYYEEEEEDYYDEWDWDEEW